MLPNTTVIFVHIPKTAGTTLNRMLLQVYDPATSLFPDERAPDQHTHTFLHGTVEMRLKIDLISGHFPAVLHQYVPPPRRYACITLLRQPVERVVSLYHEVLKNPLHYAYQHGFDASMSLRDYVRWHVTQGETHNGQTHVISGGISERDTPQAALRRAKANIVRLFAVAGLTEMFDASVVLMKRKLRWPRTPLYVRENTTAGRLPLEQIPPEAVRDIEACNPLDLALYRFAVRYFWLQRLLQGRSFRREVRDYQQRVSQHQRGAPVLESARVPPVASTSEPGQPEREGGAGY